MKNLTLAGVSWWPHSGGRWFCRSIMNQHSKLFLTTFVHPWLFYSTDMTMDLDITAQVHKARSMPDLKDHLRALKTSIDSGRIQGLKDYFDYARTNYLKTDAKETVIFGEMCMGSPIPRALEISTLFKACPDFKLVHLIRDPAQSYSSFATRHELDSDPVKIAGSWLTLNADIRVFKEKNPELAGQILLVKYEALLSDPERTVKEVCSWLNLDFEPSMLENTKQRWGKNTQKNVDQEIQDAIYDIAGAELKKYGYDNPVISGI